MNNLRKTTLISFAGLIIVAMAVMAFTRKTNLIVTSDAFKSNGMIPVKYSCDGGAVSPPLKVMGVPAGAKSLALTLHDPDAPKPGGVTHWVLWNLPVDGNIPESYTGGAQGLNSDNKQGYKAICPQSGTHHYNFEVYALDVTLSLDSNTNKQGLEKAIKGHVLAEGKLTGLYAKSVN